MPVEKFLNGQVCKKKIKIIYEGQRGKGKGKA